MRFTACAKKSGVSLTWQSQARRCHWQRQVWQLKVALFWIFLNCFFLNSKSFDPMIYEQYFYVENIYGHLNFFVYHSDYAETSSTVVIDTAESDSAVSSLRCHKILCFDLCKIAVKEIIIKYKKYFGRTLLYRIGKILFCKGGYLW